MADRILYVDGSFYNVPDDKLNDFTAKSLERGFAPEPAEKALIGGQEKVVRSDDIKKWRKRFGSEGLNVGFETFAERNTPAAKVKRAEQRLGPQLQEETGPLFRDTVADFFKGGVALAQQQAQPRIITPEEREAKREADFRMLQRSAAIQATQPPPEEGKTDPSPTLVGNGVIPANGVALESAQNGRQRVSGGQQALSPSLGATEPSAPPGRLGDFLLLQDQISQQPAVSDRVPPVEPRIGTNVPTFTQDVPEVEGSAPQSTVITDTLEESAKRLGIPTAKFGTSGIEAAGGLIQFLGKNPGLLAPLALPAIEAAKFAGFNPVEKPLAALGEKVSGTAEENRKILERISPTSKIFGRDKEGKRAISFKPLTTAQFYTDNIIEGFGSISTARLLLFLAG